MYHDLNIEKLKEEDLLKLLNTFNKDEIIKLFQLKKSDLLAQNKKFHYLLDDYKKQQEKLLKLINK